MTTAPNGELRRQDFHLQVQQLVSLRPLPVVLVPQVLLAALPDAHRMEGETETVGDGEVPLGCREAPGLHHAPGLAHVLQGPDEQALPPRGNRARRGG